MIKVKNSDRRVNFLPVCELREFGNTFVDSDNERPSTIESMSYAVHWLKTVSAEHPVESDDGCLPSPKVDANASTMGLAGDSPSRKPRALKPTWRSRVDNQEMVKKTRVKGISTTPKRRATVTKMRSESPRKRPSVGKLATRSPFGRPTGKSPKRLPSKSPRRRPRMGTLAVAIQQKKAAEREPSPSKAWNFREDVSKLHQKRAGWPEDPIRRNTLHLKKLENIRKFERNDKMVRRAELKKNHGILWTKPSTLESVRNDEMESYGENSGDDELYPLTPTAPRKKKFLTVRERMTREIAKKRNAEEKKDATLRKMYCKKNLKKFIEKVTNGVSVRSLVPTSSSSQDSKTSMFAQFEKKRLVFIRENQRDPKKVDFHVRAKVNSRLGKPIDRKVRIAYEVIMENYDSVLGPHLFYLFTYKNEKHFDDLEKAFLLDH